MTSFHSGAEDAQANEFFGPLQTAMVDEHHRRYAEATSRPTVMHARPG